MYLSNFKNQAWEAKKRERNIFKEMYVAVIKSINFTRPQKTLHHHHHKRQWQQLQQQHHFKQIERKNNSHMNHIVVNVFIMIVMLFCCQFFHYWRFYSSFRHRHMCWKHFLLLFLLNCSNAKKLPTSAAAAVNIWCLNFLLSSLSHSFIDWKL